MKKIFLIILTLIILSVATILQAEMLSENSGPITTSSQLITGPGAVTMLLCFPDGSHACSCNLYDTATGTAAGKQLPGAAAFASTSLQSQWSVTMPARFTNGLYVVPGAYSQCFVLYLQGVR